MQIPITISGFYRGDDGMYRYYRWVRGQLKAGRHAFVSLGTARLVKALEDLGPLNEPHYLQELGYSRAEIRQAAREGEVEWTAEGRLHPTCGTM